MKTRNGNKTTNGRIIAVLAIAVFVMAMYPTQSLAEASVSSNDMVYGIAGEKEFINGFALLRSHAIFWTSETAWRISVHSLDPHLGISDDGMYTKPLGDMVWKKSDEGDWKPMTQDFAEADWSTESGEGVLYLDFAILLDWEKDTPGQYGARIVFTIEGL
ncbi:MAG TPA: hypothetical protein ENN67_06810 [Firmicutes bacterium]|nr:hypothetical protein [Bacillota bacterium]